MISRFIKVDKKTVIWKLEKSIHFKRLPITKTIPVTTGNIINAIPYHIALFFKLSLKPASSHPSLANVLRMTTVMRGNINQKPIPKVLPLGCSGINLSIITPIQPQIATITVNIRIFHIFFLSCLYVWNVKFIEWIILMRF